MTEETTLQSTVDTGASITRQRKKRKWDQPAEGLIAATSIPGLLPFTNPAALAGITLQGLLPSYMGIYPSVSTPAITAAAQHNAVAIVQKINQDLATKGLLPQTKIHDELAREVVINDAEPNVRYKLTRRQTQEEIQSKTGAVVITRGKYKPPNAPADHEKPLYLHISAAAHLKETAERIRAVDQAAALVEEMLQQGRQVLAGLISQLGHASPFSSVVFVDFEAASPFDLASRIRGPNDQYINHIMNETGANVVLKGGACESSFTEDIPQPLHLLILADNAKSLDDAKILAEHLLETIHTEIAGPRPPYFPPPMSYNLQPPPQIGNSLERGSINPVTLLQQSPDLTSRTLAQPGLQDLHTNRLAPKVYAAVPPPKQLLGDDAEKNVENMASSDVSESKPGSIKTTSICSAPTANGSLMAPCAVLAYSGHPAVSTAYVQGQQPFSKQSYGIYPQASSVHEPYVGYSAYAGLYPQASPLQQVALALQRPPVNQAFVQHSTLPVESETYTKPLTSVTKGQGEKQERQVEKQERQVEKQERQRRKFQEAPAQVKEALVDQVIVPKEILFNQQVMPPPRAVAAAAPGSMPPPPARPKLDMGSPPPAASSLHLSADASNGSKIDSLPVPLVCSKTPKVETSGLKLVEYGEEDEDEDSNEAGNSSYQNREIQKPYTNGKPFWAV